MKTTSILAFLMLSLFTTACNDNAENVLTNENQTTMEKQFYGRNAEAEPNMENSFYEEDIHAYYLNNTLNSQYQLKKELLLQIEQGNDEAIEQLEKLQQSISFNEKLQKLLVGIRPPLFPLPPPPVPCGKKDEDCKLVLSKTQFLILSKQTKKIEVLLLIGEEKVGANGEIFKAENFENLPATQLLRDSFSGEVVLKVTKFFASLEQEITYEVNAIIE